MECVRPGRDHEGGLENSARVQAMVLWPTVTGADGGGDLWWPELMLEADCAVAGADGGGGVRACE
jgi:hypothetical protein